MDGKHSYRMFKEKVGENTFGENFEICVRVLRWLGCSLPRWNKSRGRYELRFWDKSTFLPLFVAALHGCVWGLFVSDFVFGIQLLPVSVHPAYALVDDELQLAAREEVRQKMHIVVTTCFLFLSLSQGLNVYMGLFSSGSLCRLLNSWQNFDLEFKQAFPGTDTLQPVLGIAKYRNRLMIIHLFIPTIIYSFLTTLTFGGFKRFAFFCFIQSVCISCTITPSLEDIIVLLTLRTLREQFKMIWSAIKEMRVRNQRAVIRWRRCICTVRSQVELASAAQATQQMWIYFSNVFFWVAGIFMAIHNDYSNKVSTFMVFVAGFFVAVLFRRLEMKLREVDGLVLAEANIAKLLTRLKTDVVDTKTALELSFLIDILEEHPLKIIYGDYTQLNRELTLAIIGQAITYLIFVEQF